jgi:hypothetical protein
MARYHDGFTIASHRITIRMTQRRLDISHVEESDY